MSLRPPILPPWHPDTNICDLLMVLPTAGAELERLGVPTPAVIDCLTIEQVAQSIGWDSWALLGFLVNGLSISDNGTRPGSDAEISSLIGSLRADHALLLGNGLRQLRQSLESDPLFETILDDFEILAAEIACHFLLEEEEWFPYLQILNEGLAGKRSLAFCMEAMQNHALTEDPDIQDLFKMFQHMMDSAQSIYQEDPSSDSKQQLLKDLQAFGQSWMDHENREAQELFPKIVDLENRLLRLN
jgi:hypothetical protein